MTDDYFDARMVNRQRLLWAIATRRQLERWEPLVAAWVRAGRVSDHQDLWAAEIEHHFALVAGHHLFQALDLSPVASVPVDPTLRAELIEGRHLHEHWPDNMPVFMVTPRPAQPPRPSGGRFAERNPNRGPYWWLGWNAKTGARLLPNVSAPELHQLLDEVEAEVLVEDPSLSDYVPRRAPSPWLHVNGEWWPKTSFPSSRPRNDASEMLNGSPKTAVSDGSDLVAAAATAPAGIDKDKDNNENGEGNEPATDPERLA